MSAFVNTKVKYREPFRPFAPAVLADEAGRWFDLEAPALAGLTPYMLAVAPVTAEGRARLPAVTHVDGSARVQVVRGDTPESARFASLLSSFREETGVGCLLNTSLNLKGEPLATTPAEAWSVLSRSELDFLVLGDAVIDKRVAFEGGP